MKRGIEVRWDGPPSPKKSLNLAGGDAVPPVLGFDCPKDKDFSFALADEAAAAGTDFGALGIEEAPA